jgi:hypothetical protein
MLMTGLSVMPVWAFSGQIDSGSLETVTCINHDMGQAAPGTVSATGFDCRALSSQPGDFIGVVLSGTTGNEPPPPPDGCEPLQAEVEPNNEMERAQDLGALQGDCNSISVTGQTSAGYGSDPDNPASNTDVDWYVVDTSQASQPMVAFLNFDGMLSFFAVDFDTGQDLDVQSTDAGWIISGHPSRVAIGVMTDVAKTYTVQFSDGTSNSGRPPLSQSHASNARALPLRQW